MQSTFQASDSGQAIIRNDTSTGSEQLIVSLHPGADSSIGFEIREDVPGSGLVSSSMSISQGHLQCLVQWLREREAVS